MSGRQHGSRLRTMSGESLAERRTELSGTLDLVDELEKTGLAGIN